MQEDIDRRTVALSIKAAKLTGQVLAKALAAGLRKIQKEHRAGLTPQGKQTVKKLMNHGAATNSLPLDGDTRLFDRIARKYNVDYAFHKTGPNKYLLFFKAGQADAITACFSEYTKRVMAKEKEIFCRGSPIMCVYYGRVYTDKDMRSYQSDKPVINPYIL